MGNQIKRKNIVLGLVLISGLAGSIFEAYQILRIDRANHVLQSGGLISDEKFLYQKKFAEAYDQGQHQDYKHAVQTYGQLLEIAPDAKEKAHIQFNLANNLFLSGLIRRPNEDGSLKDEAKYAFSQAKLAYEQALRLAPDLRSAKFNLSLLHAVMPANMKGTPKEQTGMELSNLPIGLP